MAEFEIPEAEGQYKDIGEQLVAGAIDAFIKSDAPKAAMTTIADGVGVLVGLAVSAMSPIGIGLAKGIAQSEDLVAPHLAEIAAAAVSDTFGTEVSPNAFRSRRDPSGRKGAADALGAGFLNSIKGAGGAVEPNQEAAQRFLGMVMNMALEGWYQGWFFELMSSLVPYIDVGKIESFAQLDDTIMQALGIGRMTRRVVQPLLNAQVITPLQWHVNKTYRPELLSVGEAVRQFHRGRWTREQLDEELARQGWSADRIDAFVNAQKKYFSAGDVRTFTDRNHWPMDKGIQHLRDQGFDEHTAVDALRLEGLRRIEQLEASEATAIIGAYVDRRINGSEFGTLLRAAVKNDAERALLEELAEVRRAVNIRHLSPGEARAAAKAGIVAVRDYRRALERDGYTPDAVDALELLLRHELAEQRDVEELRREQQAERAAERAQREAAAADRRAQVDADRARRRRGPVADLERAAIRGLIPFERLQAVLAADYDGDTVEILLALVEEDRQRYLAQLAAAEEARKRVVHRDLDVGALERAVMAGLLTPDEFAARLAFLKFDPADAALLAAVVREKKADQDAAVTKRREAEERARRRRIDIGRLERLVRRGARSMADYDALLQQLGFEDADRAEMRTLLDLQIADDRAADAERAAARNRLEPRGLSLDQFRRAVVLGTRAEADYQRFMVDQHFTADAQAVLLADVRLAVADAEDARRRRAQPAPAPGARGLPLSTIQRAARLGIITPDTYLARLRSLGYADDDVSIEFELLLLEIADTQAARARRAAAEPEAEARGLSLAQVERAVRAGALTLEDYRAAAITAGLASDAVEIVVAVLAQEVGTLTEAREVRTIVLRQLADRNVSLEELEKAVTKGGQPIATFVAELQQRGIAIDEAELVAALLVDALEAAAAQKPEGTDG